MKSPAPIIVIIAEIYDIKVKLDHLIYNNIKYTIYKYITRCIVNVMKSAIFL